MKHLILVIVASMLFLTSWGQQNLQEILTEVAARQMRPPLMFNEYLAYKITDEAHNIGQYDCFKINDKKDTLYINESFSIESGVVWIHIWSQTGSINFSSQDNGTLIDAISPQHKKLIERWDTETLFRIGQVEVPGKGRQIGVLPQFTTRIIINNGKCDIKTISYLSPWIDD